MADALYPERLVIRVDPADLAEVTDAMESVEDDASAGAAVDLVGTQAGPAGSSAIELPDGTVWEVDHADPSQLVQISLVTSPTRVDSLATLIGEDRVAGAAALADRSGNAARVLGRENRSERGPRSSGRRTAQRGDDTAMQVGRLIVMADLFRDPELEPLAQLAAGIELLLELGGRPAGEDAAVDLVHPQTASAERRVAFLAGEVGDDELLELGSQDREQLTRIRRAAQSLAGRAPALQLPLERLLVRIDQVDSQLDGFLASEADSVAYSEAAGGTFAGAPAALRVSEEPRTVEDFRQHERVEPALLRVTVARDLGGRWVRVLRADGLVLLAAAPLLADGLLQTAELAVPPDVADQDLLVEVVDGATVVAPARPAELVRDAVRAAATPHDRHGSATRPRLGGVGWSALGSGTGRATATEPHSRERWQIRTRGTARSSRSCATP